MRALVSSLCRPRPAGLAGTYIPSISGHRQRCRNSSNPNMLPCQVRTMAAAILKSMAEWIERELINVDQPDRQVAVITALEEILTDTHVPRQPQPQSRRDSYASQSVPHAIPETEVAELRPEDSARDPNSILDTQVCLACMLHAAWGMGIAQLYLCWQTSIGCEAG